MVTGWGNNMELRAKMVDRPKVPTVYIKQKSIGDSNLPSTRIVNKAAVGGMGPVVLKARKSDIMAKHYNY